MYLLELITMLASSPVVFGGNPGGFLVHIPGRYRKVDHALEHFIVALETAIRVGTVDVV